MNFLIGIVRNITRRPSRSLLTTLGIAIGIFALVVVGGLAERINLIVSKGLDYYGQRIIVQDGSNNGSLFRLTQPINLDRLDQVRKISGVLAAYPQIITLYPDLTDTTSFSSPPFIVGIDPRSNNDDPVKLIIQAGRDLYIGEETTVVLGEDVQKKVGKKIGDELVISGTTFKVVGVYEKSFTVLDTAAVISLVDAQRIYQPLTSQTNSSTTPYNPAQIASQIIVFFKPGTNSTLLAKTISNQVSGVKALDPESFKKQVESNARLFNTIVFGSALLALIIGSLSVINTMITAVAERTREIGIRKAIGASGGRILADFLAEAATIGFLGGLLGVFFGEITIQFINFKTQQNGSALFQVTPRLLIGSYLFSIILASLAGLYPAWRASRLSPLEALNK